MDYNFTERDEFNFRTNFSYWFEEMLKVLERRVYIDKDEIINLREKEKRKSVKEYEFANTLIGRMLVGMYLKSPYRKHYYEIYDLMLLFLKDLNLSELSIYDFKCNGSYRIDLKTFYLKYFKERYDKLDEIHERILSMDYDSAEKEGLHAQYDECLKNIIPHYDEIEIKNGYEL